MVPQPSTRKSTPITTTAQLQAFCDRIAKDPFIAVDTESGTLRFGAAADWGLRLILRKVGINESKDVQIIQAGGGGP